MDSFVVSARKYRPANFHSVVGQESITTTLKNAIKNHQLAQAFLFCGPRGVGKTTCARILAKTINCENPSADFEACNVCISCTSFQEGRSLNVYELDAASNNSVDDIRSLIDQVYYPPQYGTHKVYIIDEVHMLSTQAFNAFLKTLEEPPKYAIFILATTERHKIIPTILSRCQIFDFKRIQIPDITKHLKYIAQEENVEFSEDALTIISQKADGALRDALSLFDQLCTFTGNHLSYQAVIENLNILDYEYYFKLCDCFHQGDISQSVLLFNEILQKGFDGHHFVEGLASHFRNLMMASNANTIYLLEVGENISKKYQQQQANFPKDILIDSLNLVTKTDLDYKNTKNQRLLVEVMLMNICKVRENLEKKNSQLEYTPEIKKEPVSKISKTIDPVVSITNEKKTTDINSKLDQEIKNISPVTTISNSKTISINDLLNTPEKKNTDLANNDFVSIKNNEPFTIEKLLPVWQEFAEKVKQEGKGMLYTILCNPPVLLDDNKIQVTLFNRSLEDEFNTHRLEILTHLRNILNNDFIYLESIVQAIESKNKLYTAKDKFEYLSKSNPNILLLKDTFSLEIEM